MLNKKKVINYRLAGSDTPVTRESLENYNIFSMFFVTKDGLVIPITAYTDHNTLSHICGGKYMYKQDLEALVFSA